MDKTAKVVLDGQEYELPVVVGTEDEVGIDISKFRGTSGAITLSSLLNTQSFRK
jgi:citrate synthase